MAVWRRTWAIGLACAMVFLVTGCSSYRPARVGREAQTERFSLAGTGSELGRGAANIAFCWLEIPHEIEANVRDERLGDPFGVVSAAFSAVIGAVNGAVWSVERAVGGAFEVVLSPFPPYGPLMEPAYPPYLNPAKTEDADVKD